MFLLANLKDKQLCAIYSCFTLTDECACLNLNLHERSNFLTFSSSFSFHLKCNFKNNN